MYTLISGCQLIIHPAAFFPYPPPHANKVVYCPTLISTNICSSVKTQREQNVKKKYKKSNIHFIVHFDWFLSSVLPLIN